MKPDRTDTGTKQRSRSLVDLSRELGVLGGLDAAEMERTEAFRAIWAFPYRAPQLHVYEAPGVLVRITDGDAIARRRAARFILEVVPR